MRPARIAQGITVEGAARFAFWLGVTLLLAFAASLLIVHLLDSGSEQAAVVDDAGVLFFRVGLLAIAVATAFGIVNLVIRFRGR